MDSQLELDIDDPGRLRESALLQRSKITEVKVHQLPANVAAWWQKLDKMLNDSAATQALSKEAVDQEDEQTL